MRTGEAIFRHISHHSPASQIGTWAAALNWHAKRGGSVAGAARDAGVAPSTFRGWLKGAVPRPARAGGIVAAAQAAQRRAWLPPGRERRLSRPGAMGGLAFEGQYGYGDVEVSFTPSTAGFTRGRTRNVAIGRYLDEDLGAELVSAYLDGADLHQLEAVFADGIYGAPFYSNSFDPDGPDRDAWDITGMNGWG